MKNRKTNFIKLGILFFGISFLLWNCENEEKADINPQKTWKMKDISKTELNDKIDFNSFIETLKPKKRTSHLSKKQKDTLYNFMIDYSTIREIQIENKTSYTFKVIRENTSNIFFENLVVISSNNKIQNAYLIKYSPTKEIQHLENHNASSFEGNVNLIKLDLSNLNYNLKGTYCTDVWVAYCSWSHPHVAGPTCFLPQDGRISYSLETICEDDGFLEPPIDTGHGGGDSFGGGPSGDGNAVPTSPIGITNQDNKCEEIPKGDLNGDCMLDYYEACLLNGNPQEVCDCAVVSDDLNECIDDYFDEQIFVDESFKNNTCLKSVYDKMGKASKFKEYLQNFEATASVADLRFTADHNFGNTEPSKYHNAMAITKPPLTNNEIKIKFNTDPNTAGNILNKPDVFKAVSMIHEVIHAEMYRKMLDAMIVAQGNGTTLDWTDLTYDEFRQYIDVTLQNKYFGIWDYYVRYDDNDDTPDNGQHQQMAQHYRDIVKQALTDYDPTLTEEQKEALSWIGLNEANIVAWQNLDEDPNLDTQQEQDAINATITQIKDTFPNGCN